jgi:aspartate/methionine/tyrosine aminotransferase
LEEAFVSLAPGSIFGRGAEKFVRISIVQPVERIKEAMGRIQAWLG